MRDTLLIRGGEETEDPRLVHYLFHGRGAGWFWLLPRLWLGYQWINASAHKLSSPAWMQTGEALRGFWTAAVALPKTGRPPVSYDWYRAFLQGLLDAQAHTWFAKLIAVGELCVGVALILGAFAGIAAFLGAFMNWNFMMAGSTGANPLLIVVEFGLIVAWKVCGRIGADFFLLAWIGARKQNMDPEEAASGERTPAMAGIAAEPGGRG